MEDQAVLLQGLIQSFFEAAMFCFVLLWVPTLKAASYADGSGDVPTGILFSCLMVCIMIGSSAYGMFRSSGVATEDIAWVSGVCRTQLACLFAYRLCGNA